MLALDEIRKPLIDNEVRMGNQNGRKPTPNGVPRSPVPSDFGFEQKVRDLFPPNGKGEEIDVAAGEILVREGEVYEENAAAFFIVKGELVMQQVCQAVGKGYVTETVATFLPGDLAYSQGVCTQIAKQRAKVRLVAAKDSVVMRLPKEHVHWLGSLGRNIEMHGILTDQVLESRRALRESVEFDEGMSRLYRMVCTKRGFVGSAREFLTLVWNAYDQLPVLKSQIEKLETAIEEQLETITDQERQIVELENRVTSAPGPAPAVNPNPALETRIAELESEIADAAETRRVLEARNRENVSNAMNFAQTYTLISDEQKALAANVHDLRTQLHAERETSKTLAVENAKSGKHVQDVYDAMEERAKGANMFMTRVQDVLRKRGVPLVVIEPTDEELALLRTKPIEREPAIVTQTEGEDPLEGFGDTLDAPSELRQTSPGFRFSALDDPFDPKTPTPSERTTIPVPLTRTVSDLPKPPRPTKPRTDPRREPSFRMPSITDLKAVDGTPQATQKYRMEDLQAEIARTKDASQRITPPRPPEPPPEEMLDPVLSQTADYDLSGDIGDAITVEQHFDIDVAEAPAETDAESDDDPYNPGRSTAFYDNAPFSEKEKPAPVTLKAGLPATSTLRRGTIMGVPPTDEDPPKRR